MSELIDCRNDLTAEMILRAIARKDNGNIYLTTQGLEAGNGFGAEFQVVYDSWAVKPTEADALLMNTMVVSLVVDGVWAKLDWFSVFAVHAEAESLTNWINPGTNDATNVHATAWVAFEGYTGDGANDYLNTNFNPNTEGVNYVQNSASIGLYCRTDVSANGLDMGVIDGTGDYFINTSNAANNAAARINDGNTRSIANADGKGLYINSRTGVNNRILHRNKAILAPDDNVASQAPNSNNIFILAGNDGTGTDVSHKADQISMAFAGGGFTTTNRDDMSDAFNTYMTAKGKNVY